MQEKFYLLDYLKCIRNINSEIYDLLKYELDSKIYYYGEHFKNPKENKYKSTRSMDLTFKKKLRYGCIYFRSIKLKNIDQAKKNIISNAYFSVNDQLRKLGYNVYSPCWSSCRDRDMLVDFNLWKECETINEIFNYGDFKDILGESFIIRIERFGKQLKNYYLRNNISALIVPNDMSFFENLSIKIFKEIKRPSFVFLHGLPSRYNNIDDNRADYLIVWGDKIKENYVNAGLDPQKILVSGHPYYKKYNISELNFDFSNVLVLTNSIPGGQIFSNQAMLLSSRGSLIYYLYSIQNVLQQFFVEKVRFRTHPSENSEWYMKFIDEKFFEPDNDNLEDSLKKSSLVIGPTSTILLEAVYYGVNYVVFEPCVDNINIINQVLVPPFDGSDNRIPVAKNEADLVQILSNRTKADTVFYNDYIKTPFDMCFMQNLI